MTEWNEASVDVEFHDPSMGVPRGMRRSLWSHTEYGAISEEEFEGLSVLWQDWRRVREFPSERISWLEFLDLTLVNPRLRSIIFSGDEEMNLALAN